MENTYINTTICEEITGCKFALVSKFLKIQNTDKKELINLKKHLFKIRELENAMMNRSNIDIQALEVIKEYVMFSKPEYRVKTK